MTFQEAEPYAGPREPVGATAGAIKVLPNPVANAIIEVGQIMQLAGNLAVTAVRHPRGYWRDTVEEMLWILRTSFAPAIATVYCFMFSIGVFAVAMLAGLGGESRSGSIFLTASIQDPARWITGMVVAGVAGSSMTADLGARKIREELDALQVLGVDIIRTLVLPRVIAMSIMFSLMFIVSLLVSVAAVGSYVIATGRMEMLVYVQSIFDTITAIQLLGGMGVVFLFGLMTGLVCSHKGLNAGGGPEGVGRAVNEAVVMCFIGMFALNVVWNTITQAAFPQMNVAR